MAYQPVIEESTCLAHGDCAALAPDVFHLEETAVVVGTAPDDQLIAIAQACPACAISIIDQATGEQVYP